MPEYLTPGVYVEETSFRSRSIEGVPTSTFGMAGRTEYGPVPYAIGDEILMIPAPTLVTSVTEYERAFGGLDIDGVECQLALAARAFFSNGGRRLYVSRVFPFTMTAGPNPAIDLDANFASLPVPATGPNPLARWRARWPGTLGRRIKVSVEFRRSKNVLVGGELRGVGPGAAVEIAAANATAPPDNVPPVAANIRLVARDATGALGYEPAAPGGPVVQPTGTAFHITLVVTVELRSAIEVGTARVDVYSELELGRDHPRSIFKVLEHRDPPDEFGLVWLQDAGVTPAPPPAQLLSALLSPPTGGFQPTGGFLTGGGPGSPLDADVLKGEPADPDNFRQPATGLEALGELEDIAIVACPDTVTLDPAPQRTAVNNLIEHCQRLRYRIAVVDPPRNSSISEVREFRSQFDTKYGALYYPWVRLVDPTRKPDPGGPTPMLDLPPSGYVAGIYARSDIERGVHKAPANEVVLGIDSFVTNITFDRQSVLNPEGINALRFFEGRANRVWGARTMSSDPEWKYVNVRRLFIYLEHSIDRSTQWAVFEPNNERLWASIRQTIEDFLLATWRTGALMGTRPEEAFFVRCDRTTMTQNDLDNGRLICLIGVAPTYPAEFVIFRIGQWTADARRS
jgi:phage tail sheath protein FI